MKRAALALAFFAASTSAASAGGYLGLGVGTNAISEDGDRIEGDGRSLRLIGGHRWGRFSVEGQLAGFGFLLADRSGASPMDAYQLSVAGKYSHPLGSSFEAYGRAGLQRTWASGEIDTYDAAGSGFLVGAGFEYVVNTGIGAGSIWVDYQLNRASLTSDRFELEGATSRQWTLGVSVRF